MGKKIEVYEAGPRDGFQSLKCAMVPTEEKLQIIDALMKAGVKHMEFTSFVSPKAIPQLADAAEVTRAVREKYPDAEPGSIPVALLQLFDTVTSSDESEGLEAITEYTDKVSVIKYEVSGQNQSDGRTAAENLYTTNPECKLFLTTSNAVSLGVNSFYTSIDSPVDDLSDYGTWGTNASEEALMAIVASMDNSSMVRGINVQAGVNETIHDFLELSEGLVNGTVEHEEQPASVYVVTAENVFQFFDEGKTSLQWDFDADAAVLQPSDEPAE